MDGWLKALIAAACCVVIGWGSYLGWFEFQRRVEAARIAQIEQDLATAEAAEIRKQQEIARRTARNAECHRIANDLRSYKIFDAPKDVAPKAELVVQIKQCAADGKLGRDDATDMRPFLQ